MQTPSNLVPKDGKNWNRIYISIIVYNAFLVVLFYLLRVFFNSF